MYDWENALINRLLWVYFWFPLEVRLMKLGCERDSCLSPPLALDVLGEF